MAELTLKIVKLIAETNDAITVCFKQPTLKKINYLSGQYLTLIFRINGRKYLRPYSFSSAPIIDKELAVTVKRVNKGIVSNHIFDTLREGDVVEALQPMGNFVVQDRFIKEDKNFVLWGVGSGITPLFSIAKYVLAQNSKNHVTLVYGNRNFDSAIFKKEIETLESECPDKFTVRHFHTISFTEKEHPNLVQGRIDPKLVISIIAAECDINSTVHYICGPVGFKESVKSLLLSVGVFEQCIFSELFELIPDEKQLQDIISQTVEIELGGKVSPIEVARGRNILEAALDAGLEIPYSCQTGDCSICKGVLTAGELRQVKPRHTELESNEYQLCCSYPLTTDIRIKIS